MLLIGRPGSGKSATALQLMAMGADLVADDAVIIEAGAHGVMLKCPDSIKGLIEARGVGLITVPSISQAGLAFVVDFDKTATERLPELETYGILGMDYPLIRGKNRPGICAVIWCLLGKGRLVPSAGTNQT